MTALKNAGMVNEVDVQQSNAQYYMVLGLEEELNNQIFIQENAMNILLGQVPQDIERGNLQAFETDTSKLIGVPAQLLANRPDIKAAEYGLIQAFEFTNVAKTQFYPSLSITASGGLNSLKLKDWVDPSSVFFNVLSSLTQPVLNQRRIKTQHEISQINQQQALIQFEDKLLVAGKEVSDALYNIESSNKQYQLKEKKYIATNRALEVSKQLLNQGMVNYLDVLIAQESTLNAQLDLVALSNQKWDSRIQLYRALGGGTVE